MNHCVECGRRLMTARGERCAAHRRPIVASVRTCQRCPRLVTGGPRARLCEPCRIEARDASKRLESVANVEALFAKLTRTRHLSMKREAR
jgi:hypothetical protein